MGVWGGVRRVCVCMCVCRLVMSALMSNDVSVSVCVCVCRLVMSRLLVLLLASFVVRRQLYCVCVVSCDHYCHHSLHLHLEMAVWCETL